MNKWKDELMNKWINEWMNEWKDKWINEWLTLIVPWLLAATITLLFCFQQTADTNSFTSSSFLEIKNQIK